MITPNTAKMNSALIADAVKAATRMEQRAIQADTGKMSVRAFVIRCEEDSRRLQSYRNQAAERGIIAALNDAVAQAKTDVRAANPAPYRITGSDMGEETIEETFYDQAQARARYEAVHYDVKQFHEYRAGAYHVTDQHVYGRQSWNINQ